MKIALITDTHWGARNDSQVFMNYFKRFYEEMFFPYLEEHNIKTCIHLGDVVDRRKFINYRILKDLRENFINRLWKMGVDTHIIIGNHDTFYKNTNEVNSIAELFTTFDGDIEPWMYPEPKEVEFDGLKILMMPWICPENHERAMSAIQNTSAQILMGHLEIMGIEQHLGSWNHSGIDASVFSKFDMTMSGHFHHKSTNGNIYYLGNPYEITWADYNDPRGFHIFDTETRELEFIRNPFSMFYKIYYDDDEKTMEQVVQQDFSIYKDCYVKVIVTNKINQYWFDMMMDNLYKADIAHVMIVENFIDTDIDDDDLVNEAEDTLTILGKYVEGLNVEVDKNELDTLLKNLYSDALNVETVYQ